MAETQQVSKQEPRPVQAPGDTERVIRPAVDIFEDQSGITLRADMPGVSRDSLDIRIDRDTLSVEAQASISTPEKMEALHAEVQSTRYQRSFSLWIHSSTFTPARLNKPAQAWRARASSAFSSRNKISLLRMTGRPSTITVSTSRVLAL